MASDLKCCMLVRNFVRLMHMPSKYFKSSHPAQSAQILQSGCTSSDDTFSSANALKSFFS